MLLLGYPGIFLLMALESMIVPLPSELVMPFAGFLIAQGKFSLSLVIVASSLGSLLGSLLSYFMGKYGGNRLVLQWGKYVFLDTDDLAKTEQWFARQGEKTIFISRFIPVVRHLISIPAGIGKMNLKKFCFYTLAGATIWNSILTYAGYLLGQHWRLLRMYSEYISLPVAILVLSVLGYALYRHIKHKRKAKLNEDLTTFHP